MNTEASDAHKEFFRVHYKELLRALDSGEMDRGDVMDEVFFKTWKFAKTGRCCRNENHKPEYRLEEITIL